MATANEATTPNKKRSTRRWSDPSVPVVFSSKANSCCSQRVCCEAADANTYQQYIQYAFEMQVAPSELTKREIEVRFNAMAWASVWSRDLGFRQWQQSKRGEQ